MRLKYIDLCGFRGYRKRTRLEFADRFTIIDGRNGVGKSTIFDAVEFALTGTLSKYDDAKADGETVSDYLWWTGEGPQPEDHFVEVGFGDDQEEIAVRRAQFDSPDSRTLSLIATKLCDMSLAPERPLAQLCSTAIIRDEHIASLSLDLKEAERYTLVRDALGANDADIWIARGGELVALAKRRVSAAQQEVTSANVDIAAAARRIDEVRAKLLSDEVVAAAVARLHSFTDSHAAPDRLIGPVRERIAAVQTEIESLNRLISDWSSVEPQRLQVSVLEQSVQDARANRKQAVAAVEALSVDTVEPVTASELAADARNIVNLVALGRQVGLQDGHCPLCAKSQSHSEFADGLAIAEAIALRINERAAREAEREESRRIAQSEVNLADQAVRSAEESLQAAVGYIAAFDALRRNLNVLEAASLADVTARIARLRDVLNQTQKDIKIVETLRLSADLERAQRLESDAKERHQRSQERFGRARKAESFARALHDAARRAASETVDQRLDRVLPLMSELYRRLRPHPVWGDIEYSIRGDVRRFLKLQVGDDLNPQFLFSSGQRRATGLAFLLSVNLSIAWSRWRSILLDDPVQHVDDFRTVHLAELTAQLVAEGRQIICAVEDPALADLLCRRLPIDKLSQAKRITLGTDKDGALAKLNERVLPPLIRLSLLANSGEASVG